MQLTSYDFVRIAAAAHADPRTVKRALMEREYTTRPSVRARILKAARDLGYSIPADEPERKRSPFGLIGLETLDDATENEKHFAKPGIRANFNDPSWPRFDLNEEEATHGGE